jgi:hypothetical protein
MDPKSRDAALLAVFSQRGAPIAAAVRFDIDVAEGPILPADRDELNNDLPF